MKLLIIILLFAAPVNHLSNPYMSDMSGTLTYIKQDIVERTCIPWGLDPSLIRALILVESGGRPYAVSPRGAVGLMQLMPWLTCGMVDPFDPGENIRVGIAHYATLYARYGDHHRALRAYNSGRAGINGYAYASTILKIKEEL